MRKNKTKKSGGMIKALVLVFKYLKEYRIQMIIGVVLSIFGVCFTIIGPYLSKMIIEVITEAMSASPVTAIDFNKIMIIAVIGLVAYVVAFSANYGSAFFMSGITANASKKFRTDMSAKINRLPLKFFDNQQVGDVLSIITNDVDTIGQTLNQSLTTLINAVFTIVGVAIMMFISYWALALIAIVFVPICFFVLIKIVAASQKHFAKQQDDIGKMNGHVEEIYSSLNVVRVFKGDIGSLAKFDQINGDLKVDGFKSLFYSSLSYPITSFMGNLSFAIICMVGGIIAVSNVNLIGTIVACVTYSKQFTMPLSEIASISSSLQTAAAASTRVFAFLEEKEQLDESSKTGTISNVKGNIDFEHVVFGYNEDKVIIHDFNLKTKAGQKIAIVGPTGAGKTTMVNLLMRFYDLNSGAIKIEGENTFDLNRSYVRSQFGMVLQDTWLFEGTIKDNLSYGRRDATMEEIVVACKSTHCDSFIRQFPGGYDMILTEDSGLSAGQKQLLTIARAMIQDAPMLILDEATSSVDTRTEVEIQEAMDALTKGRTSFVIAHRLSTIKNSDLIIVMRDGDVIETGNHNELMAKNGFYADLYNSQFSKEMSE